MIRRDSGESRARGIRIILERVKWRHRSRITHTCIYIHIHICRQGAVYRSSRERIYSFLTASYREGALSILFGIVV